ncbi:MAG: hypothetical protein ACFCGT_02220 [Sandaracinaceae bacterium]
MSAPEPSAEPPPEPTPEAEAPLADDDLLEGAEEELEELTAEDLAALLRLTEGLPRDPPPAAPEQPPSSVRFLNVLIESERLELAEGADVATLAAVVEPFIEGRGRAETRAEAFLNALIDRDEVVDIYVTDEELVAILEKW